MHISRQSCSQEKYAEHSVLFTQTKILPFQPPYLKNYQTNLCSTCMYAQCFAAWIVIIKILFQSAVTLYWPWLPILISYLFLFLGHNLFYNQGVIQHTYLRTLNDFAVLICRVSLCGKIKLACFDKVDLCTVCIKL